MKKTLSVLIFILFASFAIATVSLDTNRIQYSCNGSTTTYTYDFQIYEDDDLVVIKSDATSLTETLLVLNTDYTVTGAGDEDGGTVVLTTGATCGSGSEITILRAIDTLQDIDLVDGEAFSAEALETGYDKGILIDQDQKEQLGRALLFKKSSTLSNLELPNPVANMAIGWDSSATALTNLSASGATSTIFDHIGNYADLATAIASIGSGVSTLVIDEATVIANGVTVTVPSTLTLMIVQGGSIDGISGGSTETLVMNKCPLVAGSYQIIGSNLTLSGVPSTPLFDMHWMGALSDGSDASVGVQRTIDYIKGTYDSDLGDYAFKIDFGGNSFMVGTSIDATLVRSPFLTFQNGGLYGTCADKIILDLSGTQSPIVKDFNIYGDGTDTPSVGLLYGRAKVDGLFTGSAGARLRNVTVNGYFTKSSVVNIASEVSQQTGCRYLNKSRSLTSYSYINTDNGTTLDDYVGGLVSEYSTLPASADGVFSNILHYEQQMQFQRASDVVVTITAISKANPAIVTMAAADLVTAGLSNGDTVFFKNTAGMVELNGMVCTVANIDETAGTIELAGVDSTLYTTFTSGQLWNQTGPAVLLAGTCSLTSNSSYVLTYGNDPFVIDLTNGSNVKDINLDMHIEARPDRIIRFDETGAGVIQRFELKLLNLNNTFTEECFNITGGGTVAIYDLNLRIANMGAAATNKMFEPVADFSLYNADIFCPLSAGISEASDFAVFSGDIFAINGIKEHHGPRTIKNMEALLFDSSTVALTTPGFRWTGAAWRGFDVSEKYLVLQAVDTTTNLEDITAGINTTGKYEGKPAFNSTTNIPVWASGATAGAVWVNADGTTTYTPGP